MKGNKYTGYLLALAATLVWSGNFIVARGLRDTVPPVTLAVIRWGIAAICVLPFVWKEMREEWPLLRKQLGLLMAISFLGISLFNTLLYIAAHHTTVVNMSLIAITCPLFIALLNKIFFKERYGLLKSLGFVLVIAGLLLLISKGNIEVFRGLHFSKGDLLMGASALLFSIYSVLLRKKDPRISNGSFLGFTFTAGCLMLIPFLALEHHWQEINVPFNMNTIPQFLYIGLGASLFCYYCWNRSVGIIGSTNASAIYNFIPLFSAVEAALLLKEELLVIQLISGIIILGGVFMITMGKNR